eukprot:2626800-Amphidinium_carterae.1
MCIPKLHVHPREWKRLVPTASATCLDSEVGPERVEEAYAWLPLRHLLQSGQASPPLWRLLSARLFKIWYLRLASVP